MHGNFLYAQNLLYHIPTGSEGILRARIQLPWPPAMALLSMALDVNYGRVSYDSAASDGVPRTVTILLVPAKYTGI
jgi:hypothetical protein